MKRLALTVLALLLACSLCACGQSAPNGSETDNSQTEPSDTNSVSTPPAGDVSQSDDNETSEPGQEDETMILIAYFSRTGNTETVARRIEEHTGGDLFEIVPEEPYPDDYNATVERYRREDAEDARPAISSVVENMADYDVVFVGYPNWGSDMPHIVMTFLEQYDFSGKTVIPFCTHGGGGFGRSVSTLEELCPDSTVSEGFNVSGSSVANRLDDVDEWLNELGY